MRTGKFLPPSIPRRGEREASLRRDIASIRGKEHWERLSLGTAVKTDYAQLTHKLCQLLIKRRRDRENPCYA